MKQLILFFAAAAISMTSFATEKQCSKPTAQIYFGQVAQLVFKALKNSGAKAKCDDRICTLTITNFESYDETDGCGGGTTGSGTSFTYADGKKYEYTFCEGDDIVPTKKPAKNRGESLDQVLNELGLSKTEGWRSSVRLAKVECVANSDKGSLGAVANCEVVLAE